MKGVIFRRQKNQTRQPNHLSSLLPAETQALSTLFIFPHSLLQAAATYCCLTTINSATGSCFGFHVSILWPSRFCLLCLLCTYIAFGKKEGSAAEAAYTAKFSRGSIGAQKPDNPSISSLVANATAAQGPQCL